jgi:hypothetical protein
MKPIVGNVGGAPRIPAEAVPLFRFHLAIGE